MRAPRAIVLILLALLLFHSSAAFAEMAYVEGYVYNKLTRVPVAGAAVSMTDFGSIIPIGNEPPTGPVRGTITDGNGFYSFAIDLDRLDPNNMRLNELTASCRAATGMKTTSTWPWTARVHLRPGTIARDLYLDGLPRQLVATQCNLLNIAVDSLVPVPQ